MNSKSTIISFCISMLTLQLSFAQSSLDNEGQEDHPLRMNIVKINLLPAVLMNNYSFQYERVVSKHFSVAFGARFMPNSGIPFKNSITNLADITDQEDINTISKFKVSNIAFTPEVRFYVSKKGYGRGFYIAPYYRYASFKSDMFPLDYTDDNNNDQTITLKGDIKTNSGGLMFGAQWFLGKAVTLDWWIIGVHYGSNKGLFEGISSRTLSTQEQADIKETLDGFDLPVGTITSSVSANKVTANFSGPWAGVRGGLTLGIRF